MRDLAIAAIVFGLLPVCLFRPSVGILLFSWLSYMNPHRLAWGFAFDFPFAQLVALATLAGVVFTRESKSFPVTQTTVVWLLLIAWMGFTTLFALNDLEAVDGLTKVLKIQLMALVTVYVMGARERVNALVWVLALSIGFFGVKGGIFALLTGGGYRVWGPPGSFIEDNNGLGLALIMTLPLLRFLHLTAKSELIKWGLLASMLLTIVATLATQSRGAFVGLCAMSVFLWWKSAEKVKVGLAVLVLAPVLFMMMPASWHERMQTIETYEQDSSAMGRITAWRFAFTLANQRLTGAGFRGVELEEAYEVYAPEIRDEILETGGAFRATHSIWFGMLGQHGWIGLALFVLLGYFAWRDGNWVAKQTSGRPDLYWHNVLARMLQVSLIGYAATGTFLSMEYFDFYYHIVAVMVLIRLIVERQLMAATQPSIAPELVPPNSAVARAGGPRMNAG